VPRRDLKAEDVLARVKYIMNCEPGETWKSGDILKAIDLGGRYCGLWSDKDPVQGLSFEQLVLAADRVVRGDLASAAVPADQSAKAATVEVNQGAAKA